jgi:hypothetical protein
MVAISEMVSSSRTVSVPQWCGSVVDRSDSRSAGSWWGESVVDHRGLRRRADSQVAKKAKSTVRAKRTVRVKRIAGE